MRRRVLTNGFGLGLLLTALAGPVAAVDPIPGRPLPDEPPVTQLSSRAMTALSVDLDGDGAKEMVAVVSDATRPGLAAVQAWWVNADGTAEPSNLVRLRRSATFDDRVAIGNGIRIDEEGMTGVRITEPARLLTVRREGRTLALATAVGMNPELTGPCCLTVWEVRATGRGAISLVRAAETHRFGYQLVAADLDGDQTDELIVTEPPDPSLRPELVVSLLRWDGTEYGLSRGTIGGLGAGACCTNIADAGESDGVPGEDVILVDDAAENGAGLLRLTLRGGTLEVEKAADINASDARVISTGSQPALLTAVGFEALQLWSWPRDEAINPLSSRIHRSGAILDVLGSGASTMVLIGQPSNPSSVMAMPASLSGTAATFASDSRAGVFEAVAGRSELPLVPFHGPVPGGLPGEPEAFIYSGFKVTPEGPAADAVNHDPVALLAGRVLMGTVGPADRWMAMLTAPNPPAGVTSNQRIIDHGVAAIPDSLQLAGTAAVLEPEPDQGLLAPTLRGVAPDPERPSDLIVGTEAIDAEISGPPGSEVRWINGRGNPSNAEIGVDGIVRIRLLQEADPAVAEGGSPLTPSAWLVTPTGHAYQVAWRIRVYRQPPSLGIEDEVPLIDFAPVVAGQTLAGSTMTVNGQPARVEPDGTFAVAVAVGVVPTEIRLVVTDPVGNRAEQLITRVWPIDYRQLPWVPIVVFVLLTVAGLLYVWEPEASPRRRTPQDEESTFEEIGG